MKRLIVFLLMLLPGVALVAQSVSKPFPQNIKYSPGTIRPTPLTQSQLDNQVRRFYDEWKKRFIKRISNSAEAYVWFDEKNEHKQCVSEGQGYGMVITVLMAGYDAAAKNTYDDLYRYYRAHPTAKSKYLMAWAQKLNGKDLDNTSATDGDMDMAYSLLLADKQWGSKGGINYLEAAKNMIDAIMQFEINHQSWSVLLSDGVEQESKDFFDTRSSDFMPAHFKAFAKATGDTRWLKVTDAGYRLFSIMQQKYSPDAGLLPDFIVDINKRPKPAPPNFLESPYDGYYNYNACRDPWRISLDCLLNGDKRAKQMANKINHWIRETTANTPYNLSAGYTLTGNDLKGRYYEALSFIAPFAVSASVDAKNQQWLNKVWRYLVDFKLKDFDYYDNTIKLMDMIIISGNYWNPGK